MRRRLTRLGLAAAMPALLGLLSYSAPTTAKPAAPWVGKTLSGAKCTGGQPTSGPFDYLNRPAVDGPLRVVEDNHFNRGVETLTKGMSTEPMGDIDFVLLAFPNHHRALQSATTFSLRHKQWPQKSKGRPAECYLQRAMNFSPRDPVPYKIYGYYMHRKGRLKPALEANQKVLELAPTDVMVQYNTGLILVELKRYDEAVKLAKPLYDAGLTLPGLKNQLVKAGVWKHSPEEVEAYKKLLEEKAAAQMPGDSADDPAEESAPPDTAPVGEQEAAASGAEAGSEVEAPASSTPPDAAQPAGAAQAAPAG